LALSGSNDLEKLVTLRELLRGLHVVGPELVEDVLQGFSHRFEQELEPVLNSRVYQNGFTKIHNFLLLRV